jgi:CDP-diacylglycerol--glycerol-3-phosphate 3-phosphatidyltransferase
MTYRTLLCWVPNALTGLRLVLGLALPWTPVDWQFAVLIFAGFTDLIDGWTARRLGLTPRYGQLADPVADKILVLGAVVAVMRAGWMSWFELAALLSRDVMAVILSGIALGYGMGNWIKLTPRLSGKLATAGQIAALGALFWYRQPLPLIVWPAAALSIVAACDYTRRAIHADR